MKRVVFLVNRRDSVFKKRNYTSVEKKIEKEKMQQYWFGFSGRQQHLHNTLPPF